MTNTQIFDRRAIAETFSGAEPQARPRESHHQQPLGISRRRLPPVTWRLAAAWLKSAYHLQASGCEHIPRRGPCVFVANHTSHLDVFILAAQLPRLRRERVVPIAAADFFFRNRLLGWASRNLLNAVPFQRNTGRRHDLSCLRNELIGGDWSYLLFPEGTRSRSGRLGEFRPGVGALVAGTQVPVVPCHISGAFEAWPSKNKLPHPSGRLSVRFGEPLCFAQQSNRRCGWNEVAEELRDRVQRLPSDAHCVAAVPPIRAVAP